MCISVLEFKSTNLQDKHWFFSNFEFFFWMKKIRNLLKTLQIIGI